MQKKRQDWKKAGGKDYDVEQGNFSSNYFPRVVKAGTRLWPWINALLAPPDKKPPGWKARCTNGTLLKCAHTLIPMTSKISARQELTRLRQELASCWPQSTMGMRSSAASSCLITPHLPQLSSGFPHRHIIISEPFMTLPDLWEMSQVPRKLTRDKTGQQMRYFSLETRLKLLLLSPELYSCSHKYCLLFQKWLLGKGEQSSKPEFSLIVPSSVSQLMVQSCAQDGT